MVELKLPLNVINRRLEATTLGKSTKARTLQQSIQIQQMLLLKRLIMERMSRGNGMKSAGKKLN